MNYLKIYIQLCQRAKKRETFKETEKHHVFPKFRFGENNFIVKLTLREHFIAHLLLVRIIRNRYGKQSPYYLGALRSTFVMAVNGKGKTNSYIYEAFRIDYVNALKNKGNWGLSREEKRRRMTENNPVNDLAVRAKISATLKKTWKERPTIFSSERNEKVRQSKLGSKNPMYGNKNAAKHMNKKDHTCSRCNLTTTKGNWSRWHESNCRRA